ncbi:PQQ-binding-like beta-propeller repeat protein [Candidatus Bathycorpusculum sp.]|uniref:PQQ-binding-like beta-propeller repeat protein n=1 Tax=Candidatus Bathycorpusculum sp. TaxID=2994959 RepID=UPI00281CDAAA|nr:PQQ-binding-like beta-propeller repeat protein [Candidatus Termitimicrobium sp.]MCL2685210.1 PQQ-binding-like beta-propeller repeat protein [Candidatus Termitimicrobium sp.]
MKRLIYALALIFVFFLFGSMLLPCADADWVMLRANPSQSGIISHYDSELMPKQNWTVSIPEGFWSSPVVDNGLLYVGTGAGNICALRASDGEQIWNFTISIYTVNACPVVAQGILYVCSDEGLFALDALTGTKIWSYPAGEGTTPAVVNGIVYFGTANGVVYALDALDGSEIWTYTTDNLFCITPVVYNGRVYIGGGRTWRGIYALNALTGEQIWNHTPHWQNVFAMSATAIADGMLFYSTPYELYALSLATGAEVWHIGIDEMASPVVVDGKVFMGSNDPSYSVCYALDAKSGRQLWNYSSPERIASSDPAVKNGIVYFGASDKNIYALKATTGTKIWNYSIDSPGDTTFSAPAVGNGELFICSVAYTYEPFAFVSQMCAIVTDPPANVFGGDYFLLELLLVVVILIITIPVAVLLFKRYHHRQLHP